MQNIKCHYNETCQIMNSVSLSKAKLENKCKMKEMISGKRFIKNLEWMITNFPSPIFLLQ